MLLIHDRKMIFVHIPKTGGIAMSRAIHRAFPSSEVLPASASTGHRLLSNEAHNFPDYASVTVLRYPCDIYRSYHAWIRGITEFKDWSRAGAAFAKECSQQSVDYCVRRCCEVNVLENGNGFLDTYCLPDTIVISYDNAQRDMEKVLDCELDMQLENVSQFDKQELSHDSRRMIAERCIPDLKALSELLDVEITNGVRT